MDKETRNAIERATQRARSMLEEDFSSQLEGTFDVQISGSIAATGGKHLDEKPHLRLRYQRDKIVAAIEHKRTAGMTAAEAVADYVRDAAFTTLNRFVALKMLEARELVQECISKGEQSAGYREFCGMAPGIALLPDATGYRHYIESLFDELSTEVKVLFDRRDTASVLWPKRNTFDDLLGMLNVAELAAVWNEDETIGWVYQYFNGGDERRAMREASQAPRNSRELAVRNQFFTPRYVVQFLTDNTLGRVWYEMRAGETALVDRCEYLVRRPDERCPPRAKKDPRDIRVLDPACGSGHFLLYAFDLLLAIYEEAFHDADCPKSEATGNTLADDYPSINALKLALPALVLAHNLHGVDIDPRCVQIAQLALWMRAQRAFRDIGVGRAERPLIRRSNIVVAEPLVIDDEMLSEFLAELGDVELGRVFTDLVEMLKLAGDLGLLLRVERLITSGPMRGQTGELFAPPEAHFRAAIANFVAASEARPTTRRRLFADDAAQGVGLLETAEKKYDVVLMNPPFGSSTPAGQSYIDDSYSYARFDILAAFIARARELSPAGLVGAITNRTCLFIGSLSDWRRRFLLDDRGLALLVDLGHGVLDAALVEAACYVLSLASQPIALSLLSSEDKGKTLAKSVTQLGIWHRIDKHLLSQIGNAAVAYWAPREVLSAVVQSTSCENYGLLPRVGLQTSDDFRFLRLQWEISNDRVGREQWVPFAKGGEYSPFADNLHLAVNWLFGAKEQRAFALAHAEQTGSARGNDASREFEWYYSEGLTYSERTTSDISVRVLPAGCITGTSGPGIFSRNQKELLPALGYMSSAVFRQLLELSIGSGDAVASGSAARHYTVGNLARCPMPPLSEEDKDVIGDAAAQCVIATRKLLAASLTASGPIRGYPVNRWLGSSINSISREETTRRLRLIESILDATWVVESRVSDSFGAKSRVREFVEATSIPHPSTRERRQLAPSDVHELLSKNDESLVDIVSRKCGFSRAVSKKTWYADRKIELACIFFDAHPSSVINAALEADYRIYSQADASYDLLHEALGASLGDVPHDHGGMSSAQNDSDIFNTVWARSTRSRPSKAMGVLVDDDGHEQDVVRRVAAYLTVAGWESADCLAEIAEALEVSDVRTFLRSAMSRSHLASFSRSRRKAPIYWQLTTPSASYSVWLYLHTFTKDTLHKVQNDYVAPKLAYEERRLESLRRELGVSPNAAERRALSSQETFVNELRGFLEEVKRVAPLWSPNLDDGVIINFSLLWRLVSQHKAWQKELRATWDALCAGEYDWAHLAMHLWPERVVPKCATDRSLAIAHGLEDVFWVEGADGKWKPRSTPTRPIDELVRERSSPAVKAALKSLLEAPVAATQNGRSRGRRATTTAAD